MMSKKHYNVPTLWLNPASNQASRDKERTYNSYSTLSDPALATGGWFFSGCTTTVTLDDEVNPPVSVTFNMNV